MTTTRPTESDSEMGSDRRAVLAAGLLYIATFVFSIPAAFGLYENVLDHPDFVLGAGSVTPVQWGAFFEIITALAGIGTAVVLYPVIKRHGASGSVGFVATRTLEASMIFIGVLAVLSVCTLRQDATGAADASTLTTSAQALVAVKDWTFLLGPGFMAAMNALCLAPIIYRARLVPRIIPTLGLVGAPLLFASSTATLFGLHDQVSPSASVLVIPIFFWELSLGVWMTFKGFGSDEAADRSQPVVPTIAHAGAVA